MDVIYRVVGSATGWMESLRPGDWASVMGPMGNTFPIHPGKSKAILVAGGVGLPPMLWLAEWLHHVGKQVVACVGARSADLLPLTIEAENEVADASPVARMAAVEFAEFGTPVVISTDDGSMGFAGHIAAAFSAYFDQAGVESSQTVVYTCGPERMMHVVADFCLSRGIECYVCMERAMACGTGTCQSCVVSVHDQEAVDGWRYELCCTQGPVFDASRVIWS